MTQTRLKDYDNQVEMKLREAIAFAIHIFMNNVLEYKNNKTMVTQTDKYTGPEPGTDEMELTVDLSNSKVSNVKAVTK